MAPTLKARSGVFLRRVRSRDADKVAASLNIIAIYYLASRVGKNERVAARTLVATRLCRKVRPAIKVDIKWGNCRENFLTGREVSRLSLSKGFRCIRAWPVEVVQKADKRVQTHHSEIIARSDEYCKPIQQPRCPRSRASFFPSRSNQKASLSPQKQFHSPERKERRLSSTSLTSKSEQRDVLKINKSINTTIMGRAISSEQKNQYIQHVARTIWTSHDLHFLRKFAHPARDY